MNHEIEKYPGELQDLRAVYEAAISVAIWKGSQHRKNRMYTLRQTIATLMTKRSEALDNMMQRMEDGRG